MAQPDVKPVRKPKCWTDTDMENALKEVLSGQSSIRGAASRHGLNESSVRHRLKRLAAGKKVGSSGRLPAFNPEVECALAKNIQAILDQGANLKADDVLDMITDYLRKNNIRTTVFKDGRPGKDWLRSFLSRNKLSLKMPPKGDQMITTVCKECQELGSPPLTAPRGKKWVKAWALVDDTSPSVNNHAGNDNCSVKNGGESAAASGNLTIDTERNIPIKNEMPRFTIDESSYGTQGKRNYRMNNENKYLPTNNGDCSKNIEDHFEDRSTNVRLGNKHTAVNGDQDTPLNSERTLFILDGRTRNNPSENHLGISEGNKDVKVVVERNDSIDMNPTVYILNSNDSSAVIHDGRSTLPTPPK